MDTRQLADFIAAIPELTAERFIDTDGEWSTRILSARRVAEKVAMAITEGHNVVPFDHIVFRGQVSDE